MRNSGKTARTSFGMSEGKAASETDDSRGWREPPRQGPAAAAKRPTSAAALKAQFRQLARSIAPREPEPASQPRRRRSGEDTTGGFCLCGRGMFRRAATGRERQEPPAALPTPDRAEPRQPAKEEAGVSAATDSGPMTASELIAWYRATGHSIEAIRAMFPAFFDEPAAPASHWNALDWLNFWEHNDSGLEGDFQHAPPEHLYPHL
jgi:hypothetical protein